MRETDGGQQWMAALAAALLSLTACAGPATTAPKPPVEAKPAAENPLQLAVKRLLANGADGQVGSASGAGFVTAPIAIFLADGEVSLLPNTPELEAALAPFQRRWRERRRQPFPFQEFQAAFALLTAQRTAVARLGGETLVLFAKTDDRGRFHFERVPAGQWLLVADMSSPASILLWVVPVEVSPGGDTQAFLVDSNILLEATTEGRKTP
jgi:hypothetical protein